MKEPARLIIPLWGEAYASKLVTMTLPALLAPGNLPALAEMFDVELVLVTEAKLYDKIRQASAFQLVSRLCRTRFVSLDDLMTDLPGDYGVVLTYALFRGFTDLGPRMTETYLLFLNADFIISDGSLRHLGKLMHEGKRVIHAPSFRVVLEDDVAETAGRREHVERRAGDGCARNGQARARPQACHGQGTHHQSAAVPPAVDGPVLLVRR
jgi:hypothetical protein